MTLVRNTTPELVLVCLMMMAGYAQVAKADVLIETDSSRIETNEQGVYIQTAPAISLPRPPLNSAHPLLRRPALNRYSVAPLPMRTDSNIVHCADGSVLSSRQRVYTERSPGQVTQIQQQTTATCQY